MPCSVCTISKNIIFSSNEEDGHLKYYLQKIATKYSQINENYSLCLIGEISY